MFVILPLGKSVAKDSKRYLINKKLTKQLQILSENPRHPSLRVELLEPKRYGIYSFWIDRKFRALFIFRDDKNAIEILKITVHYH